MTDRQLFDPTQLTTTECPNCGATRQPHETLAPHCAADRDRQQGNYTRRPHNCLNRYQPEHAEIPF